MNPAHADVAPSVRARLLNVAKVEGVDFNQVLVRFALERILYRMAQSRHADRFVLKGALLFTLWYDMPQRATRDADLLGLGESDLPGELSGALRPYSAEKRTLSSHAGLPIGTVGRTCHLGNM